MTGEKLAGMMIMTTIDSISQGDNPDLNSTILHSYNLEEPLTSDSILGIRAIMTLCQSRGSAEQQLSSEQKNKSRFLNEMEYTSQLATNLERRQIGRNN